MEVKSPVTSSSSTQASIIKTFRSSSKSFATSLASSISSIAGSIASGLMSIITFPASYISMALSPRKDGKKKRRVTLRVKHPKWMKFVDWFTLHSPPGTTAGTTETTTTADPEKNATGLPGATASKTTTTGQTTTEKDKETTALGIARGEAIIAERAKKHEERYLLALEAAKYFKHETETWRARSEKMQEDDQKTTEGREDVRYGDIFKPDPEPPVDTGDVEVDKKTGELNNQIIRLVQSANYYKGQLKAARESAEKLKDEELKARLAHEQLYYEKLLE